MATQTKEIHLETSTERLNFKKILPIFVIVLIDLLGLTIIIPLMPIYATTFGASAFLIGVLGAAYPAMQFIGAPLLGRLSDRFGRKPILLFSQLGTLIGFLVLGFSSALWMLFLARIIDGLSGANISTAQAAISDSTTEKTRTQGLGLIGAAFGLGFILGPIIAFVSLTLSDNNYQIPAFIAALFSFISILLTLFWFEETLPKEVRNNPQQRPAFTLSAMFKALQTPAVGWLLVLMFTQQIAFGGFEQLLALFTLNRLGFNASHNSIIFVYVGILVVAIQGYFIGKWSRKYGDKKLVYVGLMALSVGLLLTAFTPREPLPSYSKTALLAQLNSNPNFRTHENPTTHNLAISIPDDNNKGLVGLIWLLIAMIPTSIGGGILQPSINSLLTQRVAKDEIGGTLGISAAFLSASNAIAPLVGGTVFQAFGSSAPFLLGGILLAMLLIISLWRLKE
ncbi:MAG: MFS transporter [Anaerolineales bacterium]